MKAISVPIADGEQSQRVNDKGGEKMEIRGRTETAQRTSLLKRI